MEYYILCPQRPDDEPGLITHLISREICDTRQERNFHKCGNCIRSCVWRERNGYAPAGQAVGVNGTQRAATDPLPKAAAVGEG